MANGRNALRFDDRANAISFATDPELKRFAPGPEMALDPWEMMEEQEGGAPRFRYCGV